MTQLAEPPAGRREQTKQQNRQAILSAARAVFSELGYEAATVRDVIRRTGLAAGTFYNYFSSKEEVRAALAADGAHRFAPILKAVRGRAPDFASFVREAIQAYFDFVAAEHAAWLASRPAGERHHQARSDAPEVEAVFAEVRGAIQEAIGQRSMPRADADFLAAACIGLVREVGDKMLERRPVDTAAAAELAAVLILGGLRAVGELTLGGGLSPPPPTS